MHEDAQYYVDVQRQGFFQIGSKMYFCDFFSKIQKFEKSVFLERCFLRIFYHVEMHHTQEVYEMALFFALAKK